MQLLRSLSLFVQIVLEQIFVICKLIFKEDTTSKDELKHKRTALQISRWRQKEGRWLNGELIRARKTTGHVMCKRQWESNQRKTSPFIFPSLNRTSHVARQIKPTNTTGSNDYAGSVKMASQRGTQVWLFFFFLSITLATEIDQHQSIIVTLEALVCIKLQHVSHNTSRKCLSPDPLPEKSPTSFRTI